MSRHFDAVRHLLTNNIRDPFNVSIIARVRQVACWSTSTLNDATVTIRAWLADHPEHSHGKVNGRRVDRDE